MAKHAHNCDVENAVASSIAATTHYVPKHAMPERTNQARADIDYQVVEDTHTCHQGPLCLTEYTWADWEEDPISRHYGIHIDPKLPECEHESCRELVYENCEACFIETMRSIDGNVYDPEWDK